MVTLSDQGGQSATNSDVDDSPPRGGRSAAYKYVGHGHRVTRRRVAAGRSASERRCEIQSNLLNLSSEREMQRIDEI